MITEMALVFVCLFVLKTCIDLEIYCLDPNQGFSLVILHFLSVLDEFSSVYVFRSYPVVIQLQKTCAAVLHVHISKALYRFSSLTLRLLT